MSGETILTFDRVAISLRETELTPTARSRQPYDLPCIASNQTDALEAGLALRFRAPRAFTLTGVRASLVAASEAGAVVVDIHVDGESVLSTLLTIDEGSTTSVGSDVTATISSASVPDDVVIDVIIDEAGSEAVGLMVALLGTVP